MIHDRESQDRKDAEEVASLARQQAIASFDPSMGTPIECWIERKVKSALSNLSRAKDREQAFWRKLRKRSGKGSKHDPDAISRDLDHQSREHERHEDLRLDVEEAIASLWPLQRSLLILYLSGHSQRSACQELGISPIQANQEILHAITRLQKIS